MRILCIVSILFFASCVGMNESDARKTLESVCAYDLEYLVQNTDEKFRLEKPSYDIKSMKEYDESVYQYLAVVDFHFQNLGERSLKIVRKFRFHRYHRKWERFYNEYESANYSEQQ